MLLKIVSWKKSKKGDLEESHDIFEGDLSTDEIDFIRHEIKNSDGGDHKYHNSALHVSSKKGPMFQINVIRKSVDIRV